MSTDSIVFLTLDLSAANTNLWLLKESLIPVKTSPGLFDATAFTKEDTKKKSAPPCPDRDDPEGRT